MRDVYECKHVHRTRIWTTSEHLSLFSQPWFSLLASLSSLMSSKWASLHLWPCYLLKHLKQTGAAGASPPPPPPPSFFGVITQTLWSGWSYWSASRLKTPKSKGLCTWGRQKQTRNYRGNSRKDKGRPGLHSHVFFLCPMSPSGSFLLRIIINADEKTKGQRGNSRLRLYLMEALLWWAVL